MSDDLEATIGGGRVLVGIATRSLEAHAEDVTLTQLRALVLVRGSGPLRLSDLAAELGVDTSTATRLVDRLVRKGLLSRRVEEHDRRALRLTLTPAGRGLLRRMSEYRKREIRRVLASLSEEDRESVRAGMQALAHASYGDAPDTSGAWDA